MLTSLVLSACSRNADIKDEPDASTNPGPQVPLDGGIPVVEDSGLDDPRFAACTSRPEETRCTGDNDFPCDLQGLVTILGRECQEATGCLANGWFEVDLAEDGCAAAVRMEEPQPDFVACVVEQLGAGRCTCSAANARYFLGLGNAGCPDQQCSSGEFPCNPGETCVDGVCVPTGGGGSPG